MKSIDRRGTFAFRRGMLAILVATIAVAIHAAAQDQEGAPVQESVPKVTVIADRLNIRSGPSTNYEIMGQLERGDVLPVRGVEGDWLSFPLPASMPVWIHKDFVREGEVLGDRVNLRAGPSTRHNRVGTVVRGDQLKIVEEVGDWIKIQPPPSVLAWVHKDFVVGSDGGAVIPGSLVLPKAPDASVVQGSPQRQPSTGAASTQAAAEGTPQAATTGSATGAVQPAVSAAGAVTEMEAAAARTSPGLAAETAVTAIVPQPVPEDVGVSTDVAVLEPTNVAEVEAPAVPTVAASFSEAIENVASAAEGSGPLFSPIVESAPARQAQAEENPDDRRRFVASVLREDGGTPTAEMLEPIELKASSLNWPTQHEFRLLGNPARIQGRLKRAPVQNIPNLFILEKQYGTNWYPDCFVVAPKLDLAKYLGREIRVQGRRLFVESWSRPLLQVEEVATTWQ